MKERGGLIGRVLGGTYKVTRLLGEGGMGAVFEAENIRINKRFAVKALHAKAMANRQLVQRFRREAQIATDLGHPHIIDVVDFNETEDGIAYMVMEFLEGDDLATRLHGSPFLPFDKVSSITQQVCSAVHAAHCHDIVHRDLKPANIFLCRGRDYPDFVKVLDFGISKILGSSSIQTQEQSLLGTPNFMAPEQVRAAHQEIGPWTDIFSMGTILYQMVGGKTAFEADSGYAVMYQIVNHDPPPVKSLRNLVPNELSVAIARAMAKDPKARFSSMEELSTAIADALRSDVIAHQDAVSISHRFGKERALDDALSPTLPSAGADGEQETARPSTFSSSAAEVVGVQRSKRGWYWLLGVALSFAVGLLVILGIQSQGNQVSTERSQDRAANEAEGRASMVPAARPVELDATLKADVAALPAEVVIRITGTPRGARVVDATTRKVLATVPGEFRWPRSQTPLVIRVYKNGYRSKVLELLPQADQEEQVRLRRKQQRFDPERITNPFLKKR